MPIVIPAASPSGELRFDWLDPGNTLRDLSQATSPSLFVSRGAKGLGAPPVELVTDKLPFAAGGILRRIQTAPLEIDLPLYVGASSFTGLIDAVADLRDWFDCGDETGSVPGYLRVTRPDDTVRQIACHYNGGLEGDLEPGAPTWAPLVVSLLAPDPYWTATEATEHAYDQAALDYFGGEPPTQAVMNPGDVAAYPIWTFSGPGSAWGVNNLTTGKSFELTANDGLALAEGETLVVDTRPASQRTTQQVVDGNGVNRFDKIAPGGALWWLGRGATSFTVEITGAGAATTVGLSYTPRYRGVLR